MVDTDKFDILLTQEEHLYAIFRRDVFWIDREHDTITWDDIKKCPLSLSGGSVRMIMQSSLTDMDQLNAVAITTTKSSAIEWASSGRTVSLVPMMVKSLLTIVKWPALNYQNSLEISKSIYYPQRTCFISGSTAIY